jgi:hypothetical protein
VTATLTDPVTPGRLRYAAGLIRLAVWLAFHPSAPLPGTRLGIPVPPGPRGERLTRLDLTAAAYRTEVSRRYGMLTAERRFGPLQLEAHVRDSEDYTHSLPVLLDSDIIAAISSWGSGDIPGGTS